MEMDCIICCETYKYCSKYNCGHRICYKCGVRLLYLYKDQKCPICKESKNKPIFLSLDDCIESKSSNLQINKLGKKKDEERISENLSRISLKEKSFEKIIEDDYAYFKNEEMHKKVTDILLIKCKKCKKEFNNKKDLISHYKTTHGSLLCYTCVNNNHQFWYEYSSYTPESLSLHRKGLLKEPGCTAHIFCKFCSFYLHNKETAKKHCIENHHLCTVCDVLGLKFQYYKDYKSLEQHFRSKHYCCDNNVCINNMCYVYAHKSELWSHLLSYHKLSIDLSDIILKNEKNPPVFSLLDKTSDLSEDNNVRVNITNPLFNSSTNPLFNNSTNPLFNNSTNPLFNNSTNPLFNNSTNPLFNNSTNPLFNNSLFPNFNNSNNNTQMNIPSYLNRDILNQNDLINKQRESQIKNITFSFYKEISKIIGKFISNAKTMDEMINEIEDCVGKQKCLKILENVTFFNKQKEIKEFAANYKKQIRFPVFKKIISNEDELPKNKNDKNKIGFKILDASSFKK